MPIIEDETSKNLIIAFGVANKLCKKCQKFGSNHSGKCTSNIDVAKPIGNAERLLSAKLSEEMATAPTNPLLCARVLSDNDSQLLLGFQEGLQASGHKVKVQKEDCIIHTSRRQKK